ncbi:MAG: phosphopantetheine-binding protein [Polyangiaceae bacterium]|jgi:acyl carrier protein
MTAALALDAYLERREHTLDEVRRLMASIIDYRGDPGDIDPDAGLFGTGLGLDSLDAVEVLIGLEIDLGVRLEGDDAMRLGLRSVNAVVDVVMRARGELP